MATLPNPNPLTNNAVANFQYFVDPTTTVANTGQNISNDVSTFVNVADAQITKSVNATFADVGNVLTYTVVIKNAGNITANNIVLTDTTPNGTSFVANSIAINGVSNSGVIDPPTGLTIPDMAPNAITTVTWNVTVATIPSPNPIPNSATNNFSYIVDPTLGTTSTGAKNSNIVNTQVNNASITSGNVIKSANPTSGKVGDQITYTIGIKNTGNTTANNVIFTDTIPNSTAFVASSVFVNGVATAGTVAPPTGINIGSIGASGVSTVVFKVTLTSIPTINPIPNQGLVSYNYTVTPTLPDGASGAALSNFAFVSTNQATIDNTNGGGLVKSVSKAFAQVGDILTYTIALGNTGNVTANNVVLTDTIPNGTTFVASSLFVNGVANAGNPAPPTGVNVGSIGPSSITTVQFQVTVNTIPSPNPIPNNSTVNFTFTQDPSVPDGATGAGNSNKVITQVNQATIDNTNGGGLVKAVNKTFAKVGDVLTYTITLKNTGNISAGNVVFTDTIPNDTTFNTGSVTVNGVANAGNPAPPTGISVGTINAGSASTVVFTVTVNTIPSPNPIPNNGTVNYTFTIDPSVPNGGSGSGNTNTVNTQVNQATIDNTNGGGMVKTVSSAFAKVGDILTYTIALTNTGNITADNVVLTDTIPSGTSFVANSVFVNGTATAGSVAPPTGVSAGNIAPGNTTTVQFQVIVTTIPTPNPIPNNSTVKFNYTVDPSLPDGQSGSGNSNQVTTQVNQATIDNTNGGGLVKAVDKAFADVGDVLTYTITLKNTGNVTADNVVFTDTIPNGTNFNSGSAIINGTSDPGSPAPPTGLTVGSIAPGAVSTVIFTVTAFTVPSPNPIPNNGTVNYNYTLDPALPDGQAGSGNTNQVTTQINNANFSNTSGGLSKAVDKANAKIGDIITYTLTVRNTGNVTANNVVVTDTIPNGTSFNTGSVTVNGTANAGSVAPPTGVNIGSVGPLAITTVVFKVTITTIPSPNPIVNEAKVAYTYTVNPATPDGKSGQNLSNDVTTTTSQATIDNTNGGGMVKAVDKANAQVGDILTYSITLKNTGNVTADNVNLTDTIPNGTTFVVNSVIVNGTSTSGTVAPPTGINVGSIGPQAATTVVFQVVVNTIPSPNPIPNNSTVTYQYTVDPLLPDGQSGVGNSNQVTTQVNQATIDNTNGGGLVKAVNKSFAKVNDVLTYTITLKNTGNVAANNVVFTDTIPTDTTFNTGSVTVNGVSNAGNPAPPTGISIGTINAGSAATVIFTVTVNTIPNPNPIPNNGTVNYNFTIDPSVPNGGSGSGNTNTVNTQVNQATIDNTNGGGMVKTVSSAFAKVGDILTYTIALTNTGNVTADSVVLTDTIPSGTSFVANSVFVNGTANPGSVSPPTGVSVGSIAPGNTTNVQFKVLVTTIPTVNPIPNNSTVNYKYTVDPSLPDGQSGSGNSNLVTTQVNQATIDNTNGGGMVKTVDKAFADVGNVLTYTITLKNTGNVAADNVTLTDTIPNGTSFNAGSVTVNGVTPAGNPNPQTGVAVGSIAAGSASTVVFTVTVNTIPSPNPIPNNSTVNYVYTLDPANPDGQPGSGNSNQVTTQVNNANFSNGSGGLSKAVDKVNSKVGDFLNYTLTVRNTGNTTANNVVVTDTIPNGTSFVANSVKVNGTATSGTVAPPTGINIGSVGPNAITTVVFQVLISSIPNPNPIVNEAKVAYTYTVNPAIPNGASGQNLSNDVATTTSQATIDNTNGGGMVKSVNMAFAQVGSILTYTIALGNTGNVTANNVTLTDTIPNGTTFVANSLFVNGVANPGSVAPPTGVNVGSVGPSAITTVQFQVVVNTIPSPNPIPNNSTVKYQYTVDPLFPDGASGVGNSNKVTTQINQANIDYITGGGLVKTVSPNYAKVSDTIIYTVTLKNTGNVSANNVLFTDTIPNNTTFVPGSVTVNGVSQPSFNPAPPTGFTVGTILPGAATTVVFRVTIDTLPSPNPIPNQAASLFAFTVDPANPNGVTATGATNVVNTQVNQAVVDNATGIVVKTVDKAFAQVGEVLNYTVQVSNTGNVTANNVIFKDTIPSGTTFVSGSFKINGTTQAAVNPNPPGINIGNIGPGNSTTVTFQVVVNTIPTINPIPNSSNNTFTFTIDPSVPNGGSSSGNSNIVTTQVNQATIDNKNGGGLVKSVDKAFADVTDILNYTITLKNTGNVVADNVVLTDTIPNGTAFVANSVLINGITPAGAPNPQTGVNVGSINPGSATTVVFQVTVISIPTPNPIPNAGTVNYQFTKDPAFPDGATGSGNTNIVTTQINSGNFDNAPGGANKFVNKSFAKVNDVITYTIALTNTGNVIDNNVVLTDTIPSGTTFVNGSVTVNGVSNPSNPQTGVNVGSISPGATTTVIFNVVVNTIPTVNPIPNQGKAAYTYTVNPSFPNGKAAQNLTNIVNTKVNQATIDNTNGGGLVKAVDKAYGKVGDVINYTITLKNTGNVAANNVVFTDTIPSGTTFIAGSVFVDTVNQPSANPAPGQGVSIASIAAGNASTIQFQVVVNTIPSPNPIPNSGTVKFVFTQDPSLPNGASGAGNTNLVTTKINQASIDNNGVGGNGLNKSVSTAFATVGDTIVYTIALKNTGNVAANNVVFTDTMPNGSVFLANSFAINGAVQPGVDPNPSVGVNLGTVNAGQVLTLTYTATVVSLPNPNPMPNSATVNFTYTEDPSLPNGQSGAGNSNIVNTQVNGGFNPATGLVKTVSETFAKINDTLTYNITINNNGNTTLGNIFIKDTIPTGTSFILNSVTIDQVAKPGFNPQVGINIPQLAAGAITTISFNVKVSSTIPNPNPIPNTGIMTYTYTVNPAFPNGRSGGASTNTVNTQVNSAIINNATGGLIKQVSSAYADVNDVLTYTVLLKNTGNVAANNVVLVDTVPSGTTFIQNSVSVNVIPSPGSDPISGINIPQIAPNQIATVTFNVVVNTIPSPNPMVNNAILSYNYTIDPSVPNGGSDTNISNNVNTKVNNANFNGNNGQGGVIKTVDKAFAQVGEVITYTIGLQNTGNVSANNVVFTDTIPSGTTFNVGSVLVNGSVVLGNPNPQTGVNVGSINPNAVSTVVFKVTVNTIPTVNPIPNSGVVSFNYTTDPSVPNGKTGGALSNIVTTQVNQATIDNANGGGLVKAVDKAFAKVGDIIKYTITAANTGNVAADNIVFTDTIPSGTSFVSGSVFVDGVNQPSANPAPGQGVTVASIAAGNASTIVFQVVVNTIPTPNPIPNSGTVKYQFTKNPSLPDGATGSGNTNKVTTQINTASIDNNGVGGNGANKSVSPNPASIGDILTYTIVLKNTGNVAANNVVLTDTIPNGTTFVAGSVTLNGVSQPGVTDPQIGIPVGTLNASQAATITFKVQVGQTIPNPNPIPNTAITAFTYTVDPSVPNGANGNGSTNTVTDQINSAVINNATGGGLVKIVDKAYAKTSDILLYTINVGNTGNVTANNVQLYDTIPSGTTFVVGSVKVNGVNQPAYNPQNGITVGNIAPGTSIPVQFNVQIGVTVPNINPIPNNSRVTFTYTVVPTIPNGRSGAGISNTVVTQVNSPVIDNKTGGGLVKSVDKAYANIGDILNYTIALKNTGNVAANNVVVTDTIPNGTAFVPNSVTYNGTPEAGAVIAPPVGFTVPSIQVNETATVTFQVVVTTIPSPNPLVNSSTVNYVFTEDPSIPNGASSSGNSNSVNTQVNNGGFDPAKGGFSKSVNAVFAKVGDVLTYTSVLVNTGNVSVNNVIFVDTIPSGTTFVANSVTVNGTSNASNPQTGVSLGSVAPGAKNTVVFKVLVNTIPTPNPIPNTAVVGYSYTVNPANPNSVIGGNISNTVNTQVNQATIDNANGGGLVKSVDKVNAEVGDVLNYTFTLKNTGNVAANSVQLTDTVPNGTVYVQGSATVNNVPVSITSPSSGIPVGNIGAGSVSTVTFAVNVVSIPSPNPIPNTGTVNYSFVVDTVNQISANGSGNSNIVKTQIYEAVIDNTVGGGLVKFVDSAYADLGTILNYTIRMKNTGNATADNVVLTDTIPNGTSFVINSVVINSVTPPGNQDPVTGIRVGSIAPNAVVTVVFKVVVTSIPTPNPIPNSATTKFNFTVDITNPDGASGSGNTNTVTTQVNNANFDPANGGISKSVDKAFARVGDILTYTIALANKGSVVANNVVFVDTIPSGTTLVANSVFVNNAIQLGANPQKGISLAPIAAGAATTIQFQVVVNTVPSINPIPNMGEVLYSYVVNPSIPIGTRGFNQSNTVNTQVNDPNIGPNNGTFTKSVNKVYATLGDTITFTVVARNNGNVAANNVIIQDTVPNATVFKTGTVNVNSINQPNADPNAGVSIGQLQPGQAATLTFDVLVVSVPATNPIADTANISYTFTSDPSIPNGSSTSNNSNTVTNIINAAVIDNKNGGGLSKTVDLAYADIGYVLNYTISVKNTGNVTATNVVITDTIPNGVSLVGGSVTLNGVVQAGVNPQSGVNVGTVGVGAVSTIAFKVTVMTIPSPNPIPNSAVSTYNFIVNPTNPVTTTSTGLSNTVNTQVNNGTIDNVKGGGFVKSEDKSVVKIGDTLTYTLSLTNTGNVTVNNVVVTDTIPNGTVFIQGSASVNGTQVAVTNPVNGIPVGSIGPNQTSTVVFGVLVTQVPSPNPIPNTASVKFTYTVDPSKPNGTTSGGNSNTVKAGLNQAIIDNASGGFSKTASKQYADVADVITYTIGAKNTGTTTANNLVITDTIPNGTSFVAGSVTLNGVVQGSANPGSGINIGSLGPSNAATITFQVVVTQVPNPNPIPNAATSRFTYTLDPSVPDGAIGTGNTNITNTQVNHGEISNASGGFTKSADLNCAGINDTITYTLIVSNTGNVAVNNVVVSDTIPDATTFIANSVQVNGATFSGISPQNGINLNSIQPQGLITVTFKVKVTTLPVSASTTNVALVKYNYTVNPSTPNGASASNASNSIVTPINSAILGSGFTKAVDKAYADLGNILTYTLNLTNTGNANALNVQVYDTIPNGTTFVQGSVTVNGVAQGSNPQTGIGIGTIAPGATVVVIYNVQVNQTQIPNPNPIPNNADVVYQYETCPQLLATVRSTSTLL